MADSNVPLALQPDSFSPQVVGRLTQLPNRVMMRWPVAVHALPGQALVLLRNGIAIVSDNQTYLTTEPDAFSRVTFADEMHASVRFSLKKVDVEFASAIEAEHFRTAVTDRALTAGPKAQAVHGRSRASSMTPNRHAVATMTPGATSSIGVPGLTAPILFGLAGAWWASNKASKLGGLNTKRYWIAAGISTSVVMLASIVVPLLLVAAIAGSIGGTTTSNVFDDPAVRAPLTGNSGNSPAAAAPASPTLEAIMSERTDAQAATLCRSVPGVVTTGSKSVTEGAAYDAWYETMRQAGLRHDPRVLACAIQYLSPSEIPDALPRYQKLFQTYRPLDAAHQLDAFSLDNAAAARKVESTQTGNQEIIMMFADGSSRTEGITLIYIDGIWLWNNLVL